jgi:hypothetical protein
MPHTAPTQNHHPKKEKIFDNVVIDIEISIFSISITTLSNFYIEISISITTLSNFFSFLG